MMRKLRRHSGRTLMANRPNFILVKLVDRSKPILMLALCCELTASRKIATCCNNLNSMPARPCLIFDTNSRLVLDMCFITVETKHWEALRSSCKII